MNQTKGGGVTASTFFVLEDLLEKLSTWTRISAESDIKALEQNPAHKLTIDEMREYLGRDFYSYEKAVADREWIEPNTLIDGFTQNLVDQTQKLLREVRLALNAGRVSLGQETKMQIETRRAYIDRAQHLANQWESEIGGDGLSLTGREQYAHLFSTVTYDDPADSYYDVNRALESTPVYRLVKAEDYEPNRYSTVNAIQRQFISDLLREAEPTETPEDQRKRLDAFRARARRFAL